MTARLYSSEAHLSAGLPAGNAATWRVAAELRPSFWDGGAAYWVALALARADGATFATFREDKPGPERLAAWGRLAAPGASGAELELPCGARLHRAAAHLHCTFQAEGGLVVASVPLAACETAFAALRAALADLEARAAAEQAEDTLRAIHRELREWRRTKPHVAGVELLGAPPTLRVRVVRRWLEPLPARWWCDTLGRVLPVDTPPPGCA